MSGHSGVRDAMLRGTSECTTYHWMRISHSNRRHMYTMLCEPDIVPLRSDYRVYQVGYDAASNGTIA